MTQLTTNKSELAEFVKLRTGFKAIKNLSEPDLKRECATIIARAFTYSTPNGQTSSEILSHQTNELFNALKGRYKELTIPEVQKAFKMGLDNEFGNYFGMCGKTYNQFLKAFFELPQRGRQWLDYLDSLEVKVAEKPTMINLDKRKEGLIKYFTDYKETGKFGFFPYAYYDIIKKMLNVKSLITLDQFKEIKAKTEKQWMDKLVAEKNREERRGNFNAAEAISDALALGAEKQLSLINKQKEMALKMYFDSIDELKL